MPYKFGSSCHRPTRGLSSQPATRKPFSPVRPDCIAPESGDGCLSFWNLPPAHTAILGNPAPSCVHFHTSWCVSGAVPSLRGCVWGAVSAACSRPTPPFSNAAACRLPPAPRRLAHAFLMCKHAHHSTRPHAMPYHRGRGARGPGTKPRPIAASCVAMRAASRRAARGRVRSSRPELGCLSLGAIE
eukprot:359712-Chlamydomonas_euryale.AAC.5